MKKIVFPVEGSHILMFARAIGDENPAFTDAEKAQQSELGGIVAPPTFLQSFLQFDPENPTRPKPGEKWRGSGRTPSGIDTPEEASGRLHAEQHFEYIRPVRPGDVLTIEIKQGKTWEKESRRAGKLTFYETIMEFRDQKAELVCIIRIVVMSPERSVTAN